MSKNRISEDALNGLNNLSGAGVVDPTVATIVASLAGVIRETTVLGKQVTDVQQQLLQLQQELLRAQGGQDRLWRLILPEGKTVDAALAENLFGITDAVNGKTQD